MMRSKQVLFLVAGFVALLSFVVFAPTLKYPFVNWDDNAYVYQNPRLHPVTFENIFRFFSEPYFRSWTPVTFLSHAIDVAIWSFRPFGHHLMNVLLHSSNAALVFWLSLRLVDAFRKKSQSPDTSSEVISSSIISASVIAALLFALHPLRAESVAWVSDRKDLLCTLFMLLTTVIYLNRREKPASNNASYISLVLLYSLALGSKSVAMVLPLVYVLFDLLFYKRSFLKSVGEMSPLFLLAAGTGIMAKIAAPDLGKDFVVGEKTVLQLFSFPFTATLFYLKKLILPEDLSPVYHTNAFLPASESPMLFFAPILFIAVTVVSLVKLKRGDSSWALAWGVFVLFLSPTFLGLLSGIQPVADRYTYAASISLCVLVGGGVERFFRPSGAAALSVRSRIALALSVTVISFLAYKTMQQMKVWKDPMTLWTYVIPRAPFPLAYNNLGMIQVERRMLSEAVSSFEQAIRLRPTYGEAMYNMGIAYSRLGQPEQAMESYRNAIHYQPDYLDSYINLGTELLRKGMTDSAIATYNKALTIDSSYASAHYNIALALMKTGNHERAIAHHRQALAFEPYNADVWYNLGVAYEEVAQPPNAIDCYNKALELREDYVDAYINLGNAYVAMRDPAKAMETFGRGIKSNPWSADLFYNLGYVLYSVGEIEKASNSFELAISCDSSYAKAYHNLGIIHAQRGDSVRAVSFLQSAARLGFEDSRNLLQKREINW